MVRKVYVRDLHEKDRVLTVFRVVKKQKNTSRGGKTFLAVTLADRTGEIDARVFDDVERLEPVFQVDDYVLVTGSVISFHQKPQVVIEKIERLDPEPIDPKEFAYAAPPTAEAERGAAGDGRAVAQIRELVERVQDGHVRKLLLAFLDDPEIARGLPVAPAAKSVHHGHRGGLADHLLSVIRLAHRLADHYPMADRDLLVAGALLHDLGKVRELSYENETDYTDEGRLVGHLVMTAQMIREKASRIEGFSPALEHHITHLVLAHHGKLEHGSPKLPMTLEALLVHLADLMDSRVQAWLEIMSRDGHPKWTEPTRLIEHSLWKAPLPTARGKGPLDGFRPQKRRERKRDRPRHRDRAGGAPEPRGEPSVEAKGEPKPQRDPTLPKELSFKPFSALTGTPGDEKA